MPCWMTGEERIVRMVEGREDPQVQQSVPTNCSKGLSTCIGRYPLAPRTVSVALDVPDLHAGKMRLGLSGRQRVNKARRCLATPAHRSAELQCAAGPSRCLGGTDSTLSGFIEPGQAATTSRARSLVM